MALVIPLHITCPACHTRFAVPHSAIPPEGRNVKCTRCEHRWFQKAEDLLPQMQPSVAPPSPKIPASAKKKTNTSTPTPAWLKASTAIAATLALLGTLLVGESTLQHLGLAPFYRLLGVTHSTGLQLSGLTFKLQPRKQETRVTIQGSIVNQGEKPHAVPTLRVTLMDENHIAIQYADYKQDDLTIEPGESMPFTLEVPSRSKRVEFVQMDLGTGWELALRE